MFTICILTIVKECDRSFVSSFSNPWYRTYEWDYRWMDYPSQAKDLKHPCDQSVTTYRGHSVLRTLIRCYFSPAYRYALIIFETYETSLVVPIPWYLLVTSRSSWGKYPKSPCGFLKWQPPEILETIHQVPLIKHWSSAFFDENL